MASPARPSSAMKRVLQLEKQYKESRKDWKKNTPAFSLKGDRFEKTKAAMPDDYTVTHGNMAADVEKMKKSPSAWAKDKMPQQSKTPKVATEAVYNPPDGTLAEAAKRGKPLRPFKDQQERFPDPKPRGPDPGVYTPDTWSMGMTPRVF